MTAFVEEENKRKRPFIGKDGGLQAERPVCKGGEQRCRSFRVCGEASCLQPDHAGGSKTTASSARCPRSPARPFSTHQEPPGHLNPRPPFPSGSGGTRPRGRDLRRDGSSSHWPSAARQAWLSPNPPHSPEPHLLRAPIGRGAGLGEAAPIAPRRGRGGRSSAWAAAVSAAMGAARRFPLLLLLGLAGPAVTLAGYIEVGASGVPRAARPAVGGRESPGGARRLPLAEVPPARLGSAGRCRGGSFAV